MRFKVIANAPVTCQGFGLDFVDGIAWTDDKELADYLKERTYTIEDTKPRRVKAEK